MDHPLSLFVLVILGVVGVFLVVEFYGRGVKEDTSPYQKRKYLFDAGSEFNLYKLLVELFGDKYYIFPQINYSHIIEPKPMEWRMRQRYRSRIDRKSADFVLCEKMQGMPRLVIELDGSTHNMPDRQKRDGFINDVMKVSGLHILHLKTGYLDREFIKEKIEKALVLDRQYS